jgi:hypothetical protein
MNRLLLFALLAPSILLQAQTPAEPRVDTRSPEFRGSVPTPPAVPKGLQEAIDELPEADLKELVNILRENYVAPDKLNDLAIARATAQGIFDRFAPGIILPLGPAVDENGESPLRSEILDGRVGYIRLGALSQTHLGELDSALKLFGDRTLPALVLDLRATPAGSHFDLAARVCERFCPKGRVLFTVRRPHAQQELILTSKPEPTFKGIIVSRTDRDTAGAAEVSAAVLRTQAKALVIGQQTRGEAVEYSDIPLPSGRKIRVAVAEVALPENVLVFPGGVQPDIAVDVSKEETSNVLKAELENGVSPLITETERPKMNEASLVAGTNPEFEAARAAQANKGKKVPPTLRDTAVQRALDAITTIALFEQKPGKPTR